MNQYKDTTQTTTALKAQNKRQIDSQTKVTFHDVAKSILIAFFMRCSSFKFSLKKEREINFSLNSLKIL